jgi:acyl-CoA thioester hydrolase
MEKFIQEIQLRWSDLDPNGHLRHSVYYDWGALCRVSFLEQHQFTIPLMQRLGIGPILLREECTFRREIKMGDKVTIDLQLSKAKKDFSRWSIKHTISKNDDTLSALLIVDGAWLDLNKRKLASPGQEVFDVFSKMPLSEDFQWIG